MTYWKLEIYCKNILTWCRRQCLCLCCNWWETKGPSWLVRCNVNDQLPPGRCSWSEACSEAASCALVSTPSGEAPAKLQQRACRPTVRPPERRSELWDHRPGPVCGSWSPYNCPWHRPPARRQRDTTWRGTYLEPRVCPTHRPCRFGDHNRAEKAAVQVARRTRSFEDASEAAAPTPDPARDRAVVRGGRSDACPEVPKDLKGDKKEYLNKCIRWRRWNHIQGSVTPSRPSRATSSKIALIHEPPEVAHIF